MAKTSKEKPRKQKLKVFRTPIGFHDAYVAAPSRKAALEAWGADANIFAQGIAEQVTDPKLMEEPLARPGEVIKLVRGTHEEHVAALGENAPRPKAKVAEPAKAKAKATPKPSRDELDAAERALEKAKKKQREAIARLDEKIQELERERRDLRRKHERERDELGEKLERAGSTYERAMRDWES